MRLKMPAPVAIISYCLMQQNQWQTMRLAIKAMLCSESKRCFVGNQSASL
jgi:hypothetical protein